MSATRVMNVIDTVSRGKENIYMTTFTIDSENNISAFTTPEEAAAMAATPLTLSPTKRNS